MNIEQGVATPCSMRILKRRWKSAWQFIDHKEPRGERCEMQPKTAKQNDRFHEK
jgi:flagellar motor switch protein FliM